MVGGILSYMKYCKDVLDKKTVCSSNIPKERSDNNVTQQKGKNAERKTDNLKPNKRVVIIGTSVLLLIILGVMVFFGLESLTSKFTYVDVIPTNFTGLPYKINYKNSLLFTFSGWESRLEYSGVSDRLIGSEEYKKIIFDDKGKAYTVVSSEDAVVLEPLVTNPKKAKKIGWFSNLGQVQISEKKLFNTKTVKVTLSNPDSEIRNAGVLYTFYKDKPYIKIQLSAGTQDTTKLGIFAYGLVFVGYDIYLSNGTILRNDNEVVKLDKPVNFVLKEGEKGTEVPPTLKASILREVNIPQQATTRKGSEYDVNTEYQIFYDKNRKIGVAVHSPQTLYFKDSFYWNVYWVYTPYNQGYPPLYFIVLENPNLKYENGDWQVSTKEYSGNIKSYIDQVVSEIERE